MFGSKKRKAERISQTDQESSKKRGLLSRTLPALALVGAFGAGYLVNEVVNEVSQPDQTAESQIATGVDTAADICFDSMVYVLDRSKSINAIEDELNKSYQACIADSTGEAFTTAQKEAGTLAIDEQFNLVRKES